MRQETGITEMDLHGYVDGLLDEADRARVEQWLENNPEERRRLTDWKAQAAMLRATFAPYAISRPSDKRMVKGAGRSSFRLLQPLLRIAAAMLIFAAGVTAGRLLPVQETGTPTMLAGDISGQAQSAYLIYAGEVRHPVEVGADEKPHLANWLGKRLGYSFSIPDLSSLGYELVGGRLVPVSGKPGAMLMYQNTGGQRVTVLVGRNPQNRTTSFRMASADGVETFYWIDADMGYAVSGEIPRSELQKIAEECYRQFPS